MKSTACLSCGREMRGQWSHICPRCGRLLATSTPTQIAIQIGVSVIVAVVAVIGLAVLLWQLA
jgi:hypothetical protein